MPCGLEIRAGNARIILRKSGLRTRLVASNVTADGSTSEDRHRVPDDGACVMPTPGDENEAAGAGPRVRSETVVIASAA